MKILSLKYSLIKILKQCTILSSVVLLGRDEKIILRLFVKKYYFSDMEYPICWPLHHSSDGNVFNLRRIYLQ